MEHDFQQVMSTIYPPNFQVVIPEKMSEKPQVQEHVRLDLTDARSPDFEDEAPRINS